MMVVDVQTERGFTHSNPRPLFEDVYYRRSNDVAEYDVSVDGRRFLMSRDSGGGETPRLLVVENWLIAPMKTGGML